MLYSLRKLIAFVFLGGIFWFVFRDLESLNKPRYMQSLGVMVLAFAAFWLVIPLIVVRLRIRKRVRRNREDYEKWREALGTEGIHPVKHPPEWLKLAEGQRFYFHEKGTLYVRTGMGFDELALKGGPSDVAFPSFPRKSCRIQRTHFYLLSDEIRFTGKAVNFVFPLSDLVAFRDAPGGLIFSVRKDGRPLDVAFTFQNPLVARDVLAFVRSRS